MSRSFLSATLCLLLMGPGLPAQEKGEWRPLSTTAKGVTGDVLFTETKIVINFAGFTLAQIRSLQPAEIGALFNLPSDQLNGDGNLFRTEIPAEKKFLHKNTLCGAEQTQWVASYVTGKTLQLAFFSGAKMPTLTPEGMADTTSLCGTYTYTR